MSDCIRNFHRIRQARLGGKVERCHGIPHNRQYSNAEHTFGVLLLLLILYPDRFADISPAALTHDIPEAWVGDIPAPTKRYLSGLKESTDELEVKILLSLQLPQESSLCPEDHRVLRGLDWLELYIWCCEEMHTGNGYAEEVKKELVRFATEKPLPRKIAQIAYRYDHVSPIGRLNGIIHEMYHEGK